MRIKKYAFTLAETLITIAVVATLAALVVPSMLGNIHDKSNMALLRGTIENLNSAIQSDMLDNRTTQVSSSLIYTNVRDFLKNKMYGSFDSADFATYYRSYNGYTMNVLKPNDTVMLKNGVLLGIQHDATTSYIVIDINGKSEPNIIGADYYILQLYRTNDETIGVHSGDIGSVRDQNIVGTDENLKSKCISTGNIYSGAACFRLAELSHFAPDYLKVDYLFKKN